MVKINRRKAALAGVGVVGLGAVGALAAPALAHGGIGGNRNGYLDSLAAALGIERSQLDTAIQSARNQALQARVDAGEITQEQADLMRAHAAAGMAMKEAIATTLGYDSIEALGEALQDKSLSELAAEKDVTPEQLQTAQQTAAETALDELVNAGTITREHADAYLEQLAWGRLGWGGRRPGGFKRGGHGRGGRGRGRHGRRGYGRGGRGRGWGGFKKQDGDATPSATPASGSTA